MRTGASILPLEVKELAFMAGGKSLLGGISFTLRQGGITMVLGPNGAGKSLLLRLCHGLITPSAGAVSWAVPGGVVVGRKRHAMVFQRPVMLRRSVRANLDHALAAMGMTDGGRVSATLARFGLEALADQPARLLSGGEQQRLAIARAWALSPDLMFMDEPCSQLDPSATRQIEAMLSGLSGDGVTLMVATHDLGQARRLAGRILFLNRGRLVEDSAAADFFSSPTSPEAKAFLAGDLLW